MKARLKMERSEATRRIAELLGRVSDGGNRYLDAVEEVSVFGSYVAGASTPGDIDLSVQYHDGSGEIASEQLQRMFAGKNVEVPFLQALRGRQRGLSIVFNVRETLERQGGFEFITLWRRGDSFALALERLQAIQANPHAGTAPRDHVHPALAGFAKNTLSPRGSG
jgi:predicted nucleotidyltransferase